MVDNIRIRFERDIFSGTFVNCIYFKKGKKYKNYIIKSPMKNNKSVLSVIQSLKDGHVCIWGSMRKWYCGDTSLIDFTQGAFDRAVQKLASIMNMPLSDFLQGKITHLEIGINVRTRISSKKLLGKIVAYKFFSKEDFYQKNGSVYFGFNRELKKNSTRSLIVYDKCKEIVNNPQLEPHRAYQMKKAFDTFRKHGYHFLRLEFKMTGQSNIRAAKLNGITNVDELIKKWECLYFVWAYHVSLIRVFSKIRISAQMKRNERIIAESLQSGDFISAQDKLLSKCTSATHNGLISKISRTKRAIREVILKHGTYKDYNTYAFRFDVAMTLRRACKKETSCIHVGAIIRTLWTQSCIAPYNKGK